MSLFLRRENLVENTSSQYGCTQNVQPLYEMETFISLFLLPLHYCRQAKIQPCFILHLRTVNCPFHESDILQGANECSNFSFSPMWQLCFFFFFFGILLTFNANFYHSWESIYFLKSTMSQWCLIKKKKKKETDTTVFQFRNYKHCFPSQWHFISPWDIHILSLSPY